MILSLHIVIDILWIRRVQVRALTEQPQNQPLIQHKV